MTPEFRYFPNLAETSLHAAGIVRDIAQECVAARNFFTLVLAGGRTPRKLYRILAQSDYAAVIPWDKTHVFWGDERCVPPDHPDSNYRMANEALLSRVEISPWSIYRMPGEKEPPELAAAEYEKRLRRFAQSIHGNADASTAPEVSYPSFDLILLGMGTDGHTASLFHGDPATEQTHQWVTTVPNPAGRPPVPRITLTLPVINQARNVVFLVSGPGKEHVVQAMKSDYDQAGSLYPAARVRPQGRLLLFHDYEAIR